MHIAIIMDGNGRWAVNRNLNRHAGHRARAKAADAIVTASRRARSPDSNSHAFSADNWFRPLPEVEGLFGLLRRYLITETDRCIKESIRMNIIGRRDRLSDALRDQIERSERLTADCSGMHLRLAVHYSSRRSIREAGRRQRGIAQEHSEYLRDHPPSMIRTPWPLMLIDSSALVVSSG